MKTWGRSRGREEGTEKDKKSGGLGTHENREREREEGERGLGVAL